MRVTVKGIKRVSRTLATGETRVYYYHRATGERIDADPRSGAFMERVAQLDRSAEARQPVPGSLWSLIEAYRASQEFLELADRTRRDYERVFSWLRDDAEEVALVELTAADLYELRDEARKAHKVRFANYVVQVMRLTMEWGRRRGWLETNPARDVEVISRPRGRPVANRAWRMEEVEAVCAEASDPLRLAIGLGLYLAMRQGDVLRVTWSAYDGERFRWTARKNGAYQDSPALPQLRALLEGARRRAVQIVTNERGHPFTESGFRASFFKLLRKLQTENKIGPGLTFHGLRVTLTSEMASAGVNEKGRGAAIGDRSPAMAHHYARGANENRLRDVAFKAVEERLPNIFLENATPKRGKRSEGKPAKALK